jgi:hypothetical protein
MLKVVGDDYNMPDPVLPKYNHPRGAELKLDDNPEIIAQYISLFSIYGSCLTRNHQKQVSLPLRQHNSICCLAK